MAKSEHKNGNKNGNKDAAKRGELKPAGGRIDFETVRELARIASEFDLAEVEADPNGHIRVRREGGGAGAVAERHVPRAPAIALAPPPAAAAATPERPEPAGTFISSPFVGTFYRSPSPDSDPFIQVGDPVRKGQVVCIVEAMKLMNEIESEAEGKLLEILVENGEHVEYGQHLFRLARA
jgi:acetyl-CoA carboxylase biotin carboxyl carrier protein